MMVETQKKVKENIIQVLLEILRPLSTLQPSSVNSADVNIQPRGTEILAGKHFPKTIKTFVEHSLSSDIASYFKEIGIANKETWKIDVHNLSKILLEQSTLSCVQVILTNILETCIKEVNETHLKCLNDSELDISPLLQPEHITEVAECISVGKPLDVRLNALRLLLKSHFTEVISGDGWFLLQKKLVENLCDSNIDIFSICLKVYAKLASCSSSVAIKECALNLLDCLGQHYFLYHCETKALSFQDVHFYRVVHLTQLLFDTFRETTLNIARFGENKLDEMIENFIQLMTVMTVSSKQSKSKSFISPLEVVAYLDPNGKWLLNITHFNLSRRLFFSSLRNNIDFLKITIEEIFSWLSEPVIPPSNVTQVLQGECDAVGYKYSLFCHSLSVFATICSYDVGRSLLPITINKQEASVTLENIIKRLIVSVDEAKVKELLHTKGTESLRTLIAEILAKLICIKEVNGSSLLLMIMRNDNTDGPLSNLIKIKVFENTSKYKYYNNPFVNTDKSIKRKSSIFFNCFIQNNDENSCRNLKQKIDGDFQDSLSLFADTESCEVCPFELYLRLVINNMSIIDLKQVPCVVEIMTRIFKYFDKMLEINYFLRVQTVQFLVSIYSQLQNTFRNTESKFDNNDINLSGHCAQFLMQIAISPLGFYILRESGVITCLLFDGLHRPIINWSDHVWLLFLSKATPIDEGCKVLADENHSIIRKELIQLWDRIDEDCSGSEIPINDLSKRLLMICTILSLSLAGVKALFNETRSGSDLTLTDDSDMRPSNISSLIQNFAFSSVNCLDFIHHHFALTVLHILSSNMDSCLYLQHKLNFQNILLQLQSDNRVDEESEVIVDECSLLRQRIIEETYLPGRFKIDLKPSYILPRNESTLIRAKPRARGTGEFARWLSETKLGLHDHSWLKHARKLYRNCCSDDMKGSSILDLLEQVVKTLPESRRVIKWQNVLIEDKLLPEEQLAIQLVLRYGVHHRLIQHTQQNSDNLTYLILLVKASLNKVTNNFEGFDWFVASAYLICSGNIEKSQTFLSFIYALPRVPLLWVRLTDSSILAQIGNVLETIVAEEMPTLFHTLQKAGFSWWQLCYSWIRQCWWNVLDWFQVCHWFTLSILYELDHSLYFCVALLQVNQDRILRMGQQETIFEIVVNPNETFLLSDVKLIIEKLHKKYHCILNSHLSSFSM